MKATDKRVNRKKNVGLTEVYAWTANLRVHFFRVLPIVDPYDVPIT